MTIRIGNISRKAITEDEVVPFAIESIPDENLSQGQEEIVQEGMNGRKKVTVHIISLDGQVVGKEVVSTTLVTEMQPLIRRVGTQETVTLNTGDVSKYKEVFTMEATAYLPSDATARALLRWVPSPVTASSP